jgi:Leucine-rich repeat (LRR) protein
MRKLLEGRRARSLDLSWLNLTALTLPPADASALSSLNLAGNLFSALPPFLTACASLTTLYIDSNSRLTELPLFIFKMTSLQRLYAKACPLVSPPQSVVSSGVDAIRAYAAALHGAASTRALKLTLPLSSICPSLLRLSTLATLSLRRCALVELPPPLSNLALLKTLDAAENNLARVGDFVGALSFLHTLSLAHNPPLKILPNDLGAAPLLHALDLSALALSHPPPQVTSKGTRATLRFLRAVHKAQRTAALRLKKLGLTELLAPCVAHPQLTWVDVSHNFFTAVPEEFFKLEALEGIVASHNAVRELAAAVGDCATLRVIDLSFNALRELPSTIGYLFALERLNLSGNELTALPPSALGLSSLTSLDVSRNRLTSIDVSFVSITRLTSLSIEFNDISHLPPSLGVCAALRALPLAGNPFHNFPSLPTLPPLSVVAYLRRLYAALSSNALDLRQAPPPPP